MNRQLIFDQVAEHLLKQDAQSVDEGGTCLYRGLDGLKCAMGALIPDNIYSEISRDFVVEGLSISSLIEDIPQITELFREEYGIDEDMREGCEFLDNLQRIHDFKDVSEWDEHLGYFANRYGLDYHV